MVTLKENINKDYIKAFKERNTLTKLLLATIKGEIQNTEKNIMVDDLPDEDIIKILNKFSKNLKENIKVANDEKSVAELEIIESYLPKSLSIDEIQSKIDELVASGVNNIGLLMKEFATLQADKKIVSELARKALTK